MSFGERIKQRREELSLTQEEVSAFINADLSRQSVSKWERDEAYPEVEKLLYLSVKLDMSLDDMFMDELSYLKKNQPEEPSDWDRYPGLLAGAKKILEKLNL